MESVAEKEYEIVEGTSFEEFMMDCSAKFTKEEEDKLRAAYEGAMGCEENEDYQRACECWNEFIEIFKRKVE